MSRYTTTIRYMLEMNYDFKLNEYPIFDEKYRDTLNKKILDHYKFYEIGFETAERFRYELNVRMNEIMPTYNELYKKQAIMNNLDIFNNINIKETMDKKQTSDSKSDSTSDSSSDTKSKSVLQDTAQGKIKHSDIENFEYATNVNLGSGIDSSKLDSKVNQNINNTEDYIKNIIGNNGGKYSHEILNDFANKIINIDLKIIDELKDLFMMIW